MILDCRADSVAVDLFCAVLYMCIVTQGGLMGCVPVTLELDDISTPESSRALLALQHGADGLKLLSYVVIASVRTEEAWARAGGQRCGCQLSNCRSVSDSAVRLRMTALAASIGSSQPNETLTSPALDYHPTTTDITTLAPHTQHATRAEITGRTQELEHTDYG